MPRRLVTVVRMETEPRYQAQYGRGNGSFESSAGHGAEPLTERSDSCYLARENDQSLRLLNLG